MKNKKGFTLAELLIVVAIIGILVAVSIPVFTSQLTKAKEATDVANARSFYGQLVAVYESEGYIPNEKCPSGTAVNGGTVTFDGNTYKFSNLVTEFEFVARNHLSPDTPPAVYIMSNGHMHIFPENYSHMSEFGAYHNPSSEMHQALNP